MDVIMITVMCFITETSAVQILHGPENITVREGDTATFNCSISVSTVPFWKIDGISYDSSGLPERHFFFNSILTVSNVSIFDDGTTYQCGVLGFPLSDTATLTVLVADEEYTTIFSTTTIDKTVNTISLDETILVQIHLYGILNCMELAGLDQVSTELTVYVEQRCNCTFPSPLITRAHFICPPSQPSSAHPQHVTYRASITATGQLNRSMLEAVLREWPALHRAILLQGKLLSVDHTCHIIISSFQKEECSHREIVTTDQASTADAYSLQNIPFLIAVIYATAITVIAVVVTAFLTFLMLKYKKEMKKSSHLEIGSANSSGEEHVRSRDLAVLPVPEYEEIEEFRETRRHDTVSNVQKDDDYELTQCPAYHHSNPHSNQSLTHSY